MLICLTNHAGLAMACIFAFELYLTLVHSKCTFPSPLLSGGPSLFSFKQRDMRSIRQAIWRFYLTCDM